MKGEMNIFMVGCNLAGGKDENFDGLSIWVSGRALDELGC